MPVKHKLLTSNILLRSYPTAAWSHLWGPSFAALGAGYRASSTFKDITPATNTLKQKQKVPKMLIAEEILFFQC